MVEGLTSSNENDALLGIKPALTYYRVNDNSLSANAIKQFNNWKTARKNLQTKAPDCVAKWGKLAEAYQLPYLRSL